MMTGYNRTQRDYPLSFKLAVVGQVEKGEMPYKQAQQRYGIQGRSTVLVWLCKYGRLDWSPHPSKESGNLKNSLSWQTRKLSFLNRLSMF